MSDQDFQKRKGKSKGSAVTPVYGFIAAVIFGAFAWFAAPTTRIFLEEQTGFTISNDGPPWAADVIIAFAIFLVLFTIVMMLSAAFGGSTQSAQDRYSQSMSKKSKKRRGR